MRRLVILLAVAVLALVGSVTQHDIAAATPAPPVTSTDATFFGRTVSAGTTVDRITAATNVTLTNVSITSASTVSDRNFADTSVEATATLSVGADPTPLAVTISYSGSENWTITLAANPAGAGYTPRSGSSVNLNNITGTLSETNGSFSSSLQITGVAYGGTTFTGTVAVTAAGPEVTVTVGDLTLPGGRSAGSVTVTLAAGSGSPTASVAFGRLTPVTVTLSFTDAKNWSITIPSHSDSGSTASGTAVDANNISGTITMANGSLGGTLSIVGMVGNATFNATLSASTTGFEGTATVADLTLSGGYELESATIAVSTASPSVSISGVLKTSGTTVTVSAAYLDANDWSFSIAMNSAAANYQPATASTLDLNDLSGTVSSAGGKVSVALSVSGVTVGSATFDMVATLTPTSVTASAIVANLTLSGFTLDSAAIEISSITSYVDLTASLATDAGTFDVDIQATALSGGGYHLTIAADGADLAVGSSDFELQSFGFSVDVDAPATGCTSVDTAVNGQMQMKGTVYTLNNAEIAFSCSTLTKFIFSLTVAHTSGFDNQTKSATLTIEWLTGSGKYTGTFGPKLQFTMPAITYYKGFFGTVDLSNTRSYSKKYSGRTFSKHVTLGIGFQVAVYQTKSGGAWYESIGAIGYFDADRVSGDIACAFTTDGDDFICSGKVRVNPSWAGIYHKDWTNL